jgi:hypothetical protein
MNIYELFMKTMEAFISVNRRNPVDIYAHPETVELLKHQLLQFGDGPDPQVADVPLHFRGCALRRSFDIPVDEIRIY